jgi:integrator complex subunit 1
MLSALLQGRAQFSFAEVRSRNHVQLYTHVLGIIELVQPYVFQPQYTAAFVDVLQAYFDLLQFHGSRRNKQLVGVVIKFIQLMFNFFNYDHRRCSSLLQKYTPILNALSLQFPESPVLISLLAGISLRLHDNSSVTPSADSASASNVAADATTCATGSVISAVVPAPAAPPKIPMPFAPQQLVTVAHGLRQGADVKEICARLQDLDEMSKRRVDVLEHFVGAIQRLMLHTSDTCRTPAHSLMMRLVRNDPRCAKLFHETMLQCLDSFDVAVVNSALANIAEYVVLAQETALELLLKAFVVCIRTETNSKSHISDAIQMLNLDTLFVSNSK